MGRPLIEVFGPNDGLAKGRTMKKIGYHGMLSGDIVQTPEGRGRIVSTTSGIAQRITVELSKDRTRVVFAAIDLDYPD